MNIAGRVDWTFYSRLLSHIELTIFIPSRYNTGAESANIPPRGRLKTAGDTKKNKTDGDFADDTCPYTHHIHTIYTRILSAMYPCRSGMRITWNTMQYYTRYYYSYYTVVLMYTHIYVPGICEPQVQNVPQSSRRETTAGFRGVP